MKQSWGLVLYNACILESKFDFSGGIGPYGVCQYIYEKPIPKDFSWQEMQLLKMRKLTPGSDAGSCLCKFVFPIKYLLQETRHRRFTNTFNLLYWYDVPDTTTTRTRMHSSRMCTARFCGCHYMSVWGGGVTLIRRLLSTFWYWPSGWKWPSVMVFWCTPLSTTPKVHTL